MPTDQVNESIVVEKKAHTIACQNKPQSTYYESIASVLTDVSIVWHRRQITQYNRRQTFSHRIFAIDGSKLLITTQFISVLNLASTFPLSKVFEIESNFEKSFIKLSWIRINVNRVLRRLSLNFTSSYCHGYSSSDTRVQASVTAIVRLFNMKAIIEMTEETRTILYSLCMRSNENRREFGLPQLMLTIFPFRMPIDCIFGP